MRSHLNILLVSVLLASASVANANLLLNGSFESGSFVPPSNQTMTLSPGSSSLSGWQIVNDSLAWIGVGDPWGLDAQEGNLFLDLSDYSAGAPFGGVQQTIATTKGFEYTVTFYLGSSNTWGRPSSLNVSAAGQSASFTGPLVGGTNDWEQFSFVFVATDAEATIKFVGTSGVNYIGLDNVSASITAVPEPTSYALALIGLVTIGTLQLKNKPRLPVLVRAA